MNISKTQRFIGITPAVMGLLVGFVLCGTQQSDAQGFIGRLRARRAARFAQPPPQPQPRPRSTPQATGPSQTPRTRATTAPQFTPPSAQSQSGDDSTFASPLNSNNASANSLGNSLLRSNDDSDRGDADGDDSDPNPTGPPATLGIDVIEQSGGIEVVGFRSMSKTQLGGLRRGDVIVAIEGVRIASIADASEAVSRMDPGQSASLVVRRPGQNQAIRLDVDVVADVDRRRSQRPPIDAVAANNDAGSRTDTADKNAAGIDPQTIGLTITDMAGVRGVEVVSVAESSAANAADIRTGDRLVSLDGRLVTDSAAFEKSLASSRPSRPIMIRLIRNGQVLQTRLSTAPAAIAAAAAKTTPKNDSSIASGIGSVLGGFFGGGKSASPAPASKPTSKPTSETASETASEQPGPLAGDGSPIQAAVQDDLSLGDDEPLTLPSPTR